jgi:hypothetical protein
MDYNNLKIFKIFGYEKNVLKSQLEKYPIYNDKEKIVLLDNFIGEIYDDFNSILSDYDFKKFINYLLEKKDNPQTLNFSNIFGSNSIISFDLENNIKKIIEIDDDNIFNNIIDKYSNIWINKKDIPLDPLTNLTLSNDEFNISKIIFNFMNNNLKNQISTKFYIISYKRLEKIISYLPKSNNYFTIILYNLNCRGNYKRTNLSNYKKNNISIKTLIDIKKIKSEKEGNFYELYLNILFKILIEHNKFEDFNEILNIIYCSSQLDLLDMINTIRPELINLDLVGLKKIIYYGRFNVFEFLFFNIPYVILDLLSKSNPLDISESDDFSYNEDIWDGAIWYEQECNKQIIGTRRHKELIDLILSICAEKNYLHVLFTNDIKKNWIDLALEYKLQTSYQDSSYFISYETLLEMLKLTFDITNKDSIQTHINMFGKKATWNWIKESGNENFLDLFFE